MKGHWAYSPVAETPYDPAKAGRLLDAAGYAHRRRHTGKDGKKLEFTLMYTRPTACARTSRSRSRADLAKVGADVRPQGLSWDVIKKRQDKGATVFGYGTPYDPDIELYTLFHSKFATDDDAFTDYPRMQARRSTRRSTPSARRSTRAPASGSSPSSRTRWPRTRAGCGSCACATSSRCPSG